MRHFGDLQPLGQQDLFTERAALGLTARPAVAGDLRSAVSRSAFIASMKSFPPIRGQHLSRHLSRLTQITPDQLPAPRGVERGIGERFMTLLGVASALILITGATGLIWTMRSGATVGAGSISTAIHDVTPALPESSAPGAEKAPFTIPARHRRSTLLAVIENASAGPLAPPAQVANSQIAETTTAIQSAMPSTIPSTQAVRSGNFAALPEVASAITAAMANGDAQSWSAGPYHGAVVVSEADAEKCRDGTVLLRDGSEKGRTQTFRKCAG